MPGTSEVQERPGHAAAPTGTGVPSDRAATVRVTAVLSTAFGLLFGLSALVGSWRHPEAFTTADVGAVGVNASQETVGRTFHARVTYERQGLDGSDEAHLRDARPRVIANTAGAEVVLRVCERRPSQLGSFGNGDDAVVADYCRALTGVRGARLVVAPQGVGDYLVLSITARRPGEVLVSGVDLDYSYGWKRGRQHVGDLVRVVAR